MTVMPAQGRRRPRLGQSLCLLGLLLIAAVLTSSGLRRPLAAWMPASGDTFATILPARIEPAAHISLITEYSARVAQVLVQPGTAVNAGDLIVSLENAEITTQVAAAEKRVAIAAARLRDVRARENYERSSGVEKERLAAAVRAREAARERLEAFSQEAGSNAAEGARLRVSELAGLVRQGLATSAELESARSSAATADREAVADREHLSRLRQELADAESQRQLSEHRPAALPSETSAAEADLKDAENVLEIARQRASRLRMIAPVAGTVIDLAVHAGDSVVSGTAVARIADLARLAVSAPITAAVARDAAPGTPVFVRLPAEPPQRLKAAIESVTLAPESAQHAYLMRVVVANPARGTILVGLEAEIEFQHARKL